MRIVGPKKKQLTRDSLRNRVRNIQLAVGARPIYRDFARADPAHVVTLRDERLTLAEAAYRYARQYGIAAIPVVSTSSFPVLIDAAREAAIADGRGLAIYHRLLGTTSASGTSSAHLLAERLAESGLDADEVDLWLHLGFLDENGRVSGERIARMINRFERVGPWRRIMLTGSSMPAVLSCLPDGGEGLLPRLEWLVYQSLPLDVRRRVDFGDYAVQNPAPPTSGGRGMRANIRYTLRDAHFVVRGTGPYDVEGAAQYVRLCQRVVDSGHFEGRDYSWGDEVIALCAAERLPPGAQPMWRVAGTAHHLRVVSEQLQARE